MIRPRTQAFGEAESHGLKIMRIVGGGDSGCHDRIEQSGPIQVHGHAVGVRDCANGLDRRQRVDGSASGIVRVFNADQCGLNAVGSMGRMAASTCSAVMRPCLPPTQWS